MRDAPAKRLCSVTQGAQSEKQRQSIGGDRHTNAVGEIEE
jgi:hypothetical protein